MNNNYNLNQRKINSEWYIDKMIELLETNRREEAFQDFIVCPILEAIIYEFEPVVFEVIDSKNFAKKNTITHDRRQYSILAKAVPDVLIAQDFCYSNRFESIKDVSKVFITIEIKEPNSKEMPYDKSSIYKKHIYLEILPGLFKTGKVILTNLRRWDFFEKNSNSEYLKDIVNYIEIQERCAFDIKDYKTEGRKRILDKSTLDEKKKQLIIFIEKLDKQDYKREKLLENLNEHLLKSKEITENDFYEFVKFTDNLFLEEIINYIDSCRKSWAPIFLIDNFHKFEVNRIIPQNDFENMQTADIYISQDNWKELIDKLRFFIFENMNTNNSAILQLNE